MSKALQNNRFTRLLTFYTEGVKISDFKFQRLA
jgi:hypothetical protein